MDGIRGAAALLIAVRHCPTFFGTIGPPETYLAVDLFFVLSGFVLAHAYSERLDQGMTAGQFMQARLIRLYPMYALGLLIGAVAVSAEAAMGTANWTAGGGFMVAATSVLMVPSLPTAEGSHLYPLNWPAWSLLFELFANLAMGVAWKQLRNRVLAVGVAVFGALLIADVVRVGSADFGGFWSGFSIGFARVGFSFFAGVLLYRFRERLPALISPTAAVILSAALLCCPTPAQWRTAYDLACILILFPLIVVAGARREPVRAGKVFAVLGVVSYPLYAVHQPLQRLLADLLGWCGVDIQAWTPLAGFVLLPALAAVAWLAARRYDKPVGAWLTAVATPRPGLAVLGRTEVAPTP